MYCHRCGARLEPGQRYCSECGTQVDIPEPVPAPDRRMKDSGLKGILAIVALVMVAIALVFVLAAIATSTDDPGDGGVETTVGDVTLKGGMCSDDILLTGPYSPVSLMYVGDGDAAWMWRDACSPYLERDGSFYSETGFSYSDGDVLRLPGPGMYEVFLQVDGETRHSGHVIVDGGVQKTWTWSRYDGGVDRTYTVEWWFQLSDFLGYREDGAYRGSNHQSDARFVVVDSDILSLERALSDAYTEVHGHEPVEGSQDYADYLLSFVQMTVDYPPVVAEAAAGIYAESSYGSPDLFLYGSEEYWAYPMETLYMGMGDCEDTAFLSAALFSAAGYRSALASPPGHMMSLVVIDGYEPDAMFEFRYGGYECGWFTLTTGEVYRFCETTYDSYAVPVGYYSESQQADLDTLHSITLVSPRQ